MTDLIWLILGIQASRFKTRATLEAENLVLRQQLNVLRRRTPKRPHLISLVGSYRKSPREKVPSSRFDLSNTGICGAMPFSSTSQFSIGAAP
jgi:hypothetical protein